MGSGYSRFLLETSASAQPFQARAPRSPTAPCCLCHPLPGAGTSPEGSPGQFPLPLCLGETGIGLPTRTDSGKSDGASALNSFSERVAERGRAPAALALNPRQRSELVGRDRQSRLTRSPPTFCSRAAAELPNNGPGSAKARAAR